MASLRVNRMPGDPRIGSGVTGVLDRAFGVTASGSTLRNELRGGLTTFATMAYIVVVNADLLSRAGIPFEGAVFAMGTSSPPSGGVSIGAG